MSVTPQYKLSYFNARGYGEFARLMFALADIKYEDKRYDFTFGPSGPITGDDFKSDKATKFPFGQVPLLEVTEGDNTTTLAQSHAIARYIAIENGYFGKTNLEGALIDSVTEHVRDALTNYQKAQYGPNPTEDKPKFFADYMPNHMSHLNRFIEQHSTSDDKSTCVGSSITLADIYVCFICGYYNDDVVVDKVLASNPHVAKVRDMVMNHPRIKAWLDVRPVTPF